MKRISRISQGFAPWRYIYIYIFTSEPFFLSELVGVLWSSSTLLSLLNYNKIERREAISSFTNVLQSWYMEAFIEQICNKVCISCNAELVDLADDLFISIHLYVVSHRPTEGPCFCAELRLSCGCSPRTEQLRSPHRHRHIVRTVVVRNRHEMQAKECPEALMSPDSSMACERDSVHLSKRKQTL